jgi:hypothetical protein
MRSCVTFASGAVRGTKMTVSRSVAAENPESELAAFPVEAQVITGLLFSCALITTTALARSLYDAVGFCPSSLM